MTGLRIWPRAIVFDLDGTLVDSLPDIADALGQLLERHGAERHPSDAVRTMIGKGVEVLVRRAFAGRGRTLGDAEAATLTAEYLTLYEPRATRDTRLYPMVAEVVGMLAGEGFRLGVCTNKPTEVSREIIRDFGLGRHISAVVGGDYGPPRKPAPDLVHAVLGLLQADPREAVMVGDSASDIEAAKAAGVPVVAVEYGYTPVPVRDLGADVVIRDFSELAAALARLEEMR